MGSVDVVSEPKFKIGEKWETTSVLGAVGLGVTLAVTGLLYLLVGRVLKPLTGLSAGRPPDWPARRPGGGTWPDCLHAHHSRSTANPLWRTRGTTGRRKPD